MNVEQICDTHHATARCPASIGTVDRWLAGALVDDERPNRPTIRVELDSDAWAWNPHCVAEPFVGPGAVVYERLPDGRTFAAFVPDDNTRIVDALVEIAVKAVNRG